VDEPIKRSDAIEKEYTQAVIYGIVGLVALALTFLFWRYGGMFYSFSWGFGLIWLGSWGYALWSYYKTTKVPAYPVECPYCHKATVLVAPPQMDFTCEHCLKRVPIENGRVLEVIAVKCPHCGSMEQVSVKAAAAICEQCQREFPIRATGRVPAGMPLPQDDPTPYELVLLGVERLKEEQAILGEPRARVERARREGGSAAGLKTRTACQRRGTKGKPTPDRSFGGAGKPTFAP
jgi:transposase-like protein